KSNWQPSLSPDGTRMVYVHDGQLAVMYLDDAEPHPLVTITGTPEWPRWSGTTIAFEAPANTPKTAVWLTDEHGHAPRQLTTPDLDEMDDGGLAFIDGGKRIVFSRYNRNLRDRDLYVVDVASGKVNRITESAHVSETAPVASHDGRLLAYRQSDER